MPLGRLSLSLNKHKEREDGRLSALLVAVFLREKQLGISLTVYLSPSLQAEHVILWHSYSELQVLLRVDFYQTALARRDDLIRTMYERGELRPQVSSS